MAATVKRSASARTDHTGKTSGNTSAGKRTAVSSTAAKKSTAARTASSGKRTGSRSTASAQKKTKKQDSAVNKELVLVVAITIAVLMFLSLFGIIGSFGEALASLQRGLCGTLAWIFPFCLLFAAGFCLVNFRKYPAHTLGKMLVGLILLSVLCGFFAVPGKTEAPLQAWKDYYAAGSEGVNGGLLGGMWICLLWKGLGKAGTVIVLIALLLACAALLTGKAFLAMLARKGRDTWQSVRQENREYKAVRALQLEQERQKREKEKEERLRMQEESAAREEKAREELARQAAIRTAEEEARRQGTPDYDLRSVSASGAALKPSEPLKSDEKKKESGREIIRRKREEMLQAEREKEKLLQDEKERAAAEIEAAKESVRRIGSGSFESDQRAAEPLTEAYEEAPRRGDKIDWENLDIASLPKELQGTPIGTLMRRAEEENRRAVQKEERTLAELSALDGDQSAASVNVPEAPTVSSVNIYRSGRDSSAGREPAPVRRVHKAWEDPRGASDFADREEQALFEELSRAVEEPAAEVQPQPAELPEIRAYEADIPEPEETEAVPADIIGQPEMPEVPSGFGREESRGVTASGILGGEPVGASIWAEKRENSRAAVSGKSFCSPSVSSAGQNEAVTGQKAAREKTYVSADAQAPLEAVEPVHVEYRLPPTGMLTQGKRVTGVEDEELRRTAELLEQTLANFGVEVTVTDISCGPSVTRFEMRPEQGVKVSRIVALTDDIKMRLAATDIRIEAPIPGKSAVGIEVPNRENQTVRIRELIESEDFRKHSSKIVFTVGQDIAGKLVLADLAKMPHLLIAGATGSGKSVCINTILMSILYKAKPDEVQLIMIDPKVVELGIYNGIPHLRIPVVTDPKLAAEALHGAVKEMTDRYKRFAELNVRDLKGYNQKLRENPDEYPGLEPMPQIVIIVDEFADLMMVAASDVEQSVCRLTQLARAAGIHLVLATQRPSVNVITGLIKANVQSRIAFAVSSGVDSRTIIDINGAEKLLGKGDMLFYPTGYPKPVRVQGTFVSDEEVAAVTEFWRQQVPKSVAEQIEKRPAWGGSEERSPGDDGRDEFFMKAAEYIIDSEKASIGNLQRVFRIGFNRAARLMDQLADAGIVGKEDGTKARQILLDKSQLEDWKRENGYDQKTVCEKTEGRYASF